MKSRIVGAPGLRVSALGFGAMELSGAYGPADDRASIRTLRKALDLGVTLVDTADIYGHGHNESLVGRAIADRRDEVVLATKFGGGVNPDGEFGGLGRPEVVRSCVEASMRRLGTDRIDIYYLHRVDPDTPIEDTVGAMAELVTEGLVRHIGLSEVNSDTLLRAHSIHPILTVQSEYSLFTREPERDILPTTRQLGVGFVAYSPLGRGVLGGSVRSPADIPPTDWRAGAPRYQGDPLSKALSLTAELRELAALLGLTTAQIALAWILGRGEDIVPIPGTRSLAHLEANVASVNVRLPDGVLERLDDLFPPGVLPGDRLPAAAMRRVDR
jgi:aryl-alcohol dehydrogenase-like predicted oxidoreductase